MTMKQNPLSLTVLENLDLDAHKKDIADISEAVELEKGNRTRWAEDIRKVRKLIDGTEKRKNKPWSSASDTCVPLIKRQLRRWKPSLYNLYAMADPVCAFYASDVKGIEMVEPAERFFDWLVKVHMDDTDDQIQFLTNYIGRDGSGYLGASWDYKTTTQSRVVSVENIFPQGVPQDPNLIVQTLAQQYELNIVDQRVVEMLQAAVELIMQGAPFVQLKYDKVVKNKPKLIAYDPTYIVTPAHSTTAHEAPWVAIMHEMSANELRQKARDGFFLEEVVAEVMERANEDSHDSPPSSPMGSTDGPYNKNIRLQDAGVNSTNENFQVYQVYCHIDWNGDGIKEKAVLWYTDEFGAPDVLALFPYSLSMDHWPIFRFDYERTEPGPYLSQGMGRMLMPLQKELNKQYRARSDAIDIQLAPVFQKRITGGLRSRNIKWGPGRVIDVQEIGDIAPVEKSAFNLHEYINSESVIENYADTLVGSLVNDLQATGSKLERRTATEVGQVAQTSKAMASMDSACFQSTMRFVWQTVWQLWLDFGEREVYYWVTQERTPELFKKADYDKNFQLMPTGTPGNTDKNEQLRRVMQLIEMSYQDPTRSFNIPYLIHRAATLIDDRMADAALLPQAQQIAIQTIQQAAKLISEGDLPPDIQQAMTTGAENIETQQGGSA